MTGCNRDPILFPSQGRRTVVAHFDSGSLTSDGGALLLRGAGGFQIAGEEQRFVPATAVVIQTG